MTEIIGVHNLKCAQKLSSLLVLNRVYGEESLHFKKRKEKKDYAVKQLGRIMFWKCFALRVPQNNLHFMLI